MSKDILPKNWLEDSRKVAALIEYARHSWPDSVGAFSPKATAREKLFFVDAMRVVRQDQENPPPFNPKTAIDTAIGKNLGMVVRDINGNVLLRYEQVRQRVIGLEASNLRQVFDRWRLTIMNSVADDGRANADLAIRALGFPGSSLRFCMDLSGINHHRWTRVFLELLRNRLFIAACPEYAIFASNDELSITKEAQSRLCASIDDIGRADAMLTYSPETRALNARILRMHLDDGMADSAIVSFIPEDSEVKIGTVRALIRRFERALRPQRNALEGLQGNVAYQAKLHPVDRARFDFEVIERHTCFELLHHLQEDAALSENWARAIMSSVHRTLAVAGLQLRCGCPAPDSQTTCITPPKRPVGRPRKYKDTFKFNELGPKVEPGDD